MKCYTTDGTGYDGLRLDERPDPGEPGPGEALVDVKAVSLNYRDLLVMKGLYSGRQDPPILACSDFSGAVAKTGYGVEEFKEGDRVLNAPFRFWPAGRLRRHWGKTFVGGAGVDGVLAERILYPAESLVRLPAHFDFHEGSTLTIAGLTAWAAVVTHGRTRPGEWVLIYGTGGVSIFALQIAKMMGARTIVTTSSEEKARILKEKFGADYTVNYRDKSWTDRVKEITNNACVDVVVDVVGGGTFSESLKVCATGCRIGLIGVLEGFESTINTFDIIGRQLHIRGIYMESTEELRALAQTFESRGLRPHIDKVFPFEETRQAFEHLEGQQHMGKIVIEVMT